MLAEIFLLQLETTLRASQEGDRAKNYRFVALSDDVSQSFRKGRPGLATGPLTGEGRPAPRMPDLSGTAIPAPPSRIFLEVGEVGGANGAVARVQRHEDAESARAPPPPGRTGP